MFENHDDQRETNAHGESDDSVLVKAAQRDLRAFTALYDRHVQRVYRYLLVRIGDPHDAQDLTSQTFLSAMEGLHRYQGERPFIAWLLGIARHKLIDQYERKKPFVALDDDLDVQDSGPLPETIAEQSMDLAFVAHKLPLLAPDRAEAISLRFFGGLGVREIAGLMDRNEAAVRMLVYRGLRDLQERLKR
jgi:RNA polymerase sigma-70 factor (ECF subfamily)